jgi:predicted RNA-binding protein associated with RNAse of E/G family
MGEITVIKRDAAGRETWRYTGQLLERVDGRVRLEARFNRDDLPFHGILLGRNDRFVETFFTDRWYNIFAIHARDDDHLRGWYCNIGRPAVWESENGRLALSYEDLALDLLIYPDGKQLVLDEDEFEALALAEDDRRAALNALAELRQFFTTTVETQDLASLRCYP